MTPYYDHAGITIYHGDYRDVLPSIIRPQLLLTDPPYGINYKHGSRKGGNSLGFDCHSVIGDDYDFDPSPFLKFTKVIMWGANHYADKLPSSRGWMIWDKRCGIPSNDQSDCELAWTNCLSVCRCFSKYWNGGGISEARYHVSQKPVTLMQWCIKLAGDFNGLLDPFMGSGTTLRAAKDLGRKAIGIEIEERYCEIAAKRMAQEVFSFT